MVEQFWIWLWGPVLGFLVLKLIVVFAFVVAVGIAVAALWKAATDDRSGRTDGK